MAFPTYESLLDIIQADQPDYATMLAALQADMADNDKVLAGYRVLTKGNKASHGFAFHVKGWFSAADLKQLKTDVEAGGDMTIFETTAFQCPMPPNSATLPLAAEDSVGYSTTRWTRVILTAKE
ncbi:hypothetical protein AVT69_gp238 [Pseudomonas phage PhiPA3]|uniref:Uncharacterized protein 240 n=1 Tax=Pseudomonas phage PhiPA3 TaxID=998086 RepID=F8SJ83_BPPA3|nr:hypothetical protein AVT69_gp238 [Pseudomonas phage PhiPA3]AEH03663.1 hypothetical protein [Pseudomonas phage PhiPA3]